MATGDRRTLVQASPLFNGIDFVEVAKKRADYAQATGQNKTQLFSEALDKLIARDGKNALEGARRSLFLQVKAGHPAADEVTVVFDAASAPPG